MYQAFTLYPSIFSNDCDHRDPLVRTPGACPTAFAALSKFFKPPLLSNLLCCWSCRWLWFRLRRRIATLLRSRRSRSTDPHPHQPGRPAPSAFRPAATRRPRRRSMGVGSGPGSRAAGSVPRRLEALAGPRRRQGRRGRRRRSRRERRVRPLAGGRRARRRGRKREWRTLRAVAAGLDCSRLLESPCACRGNGGGLGTAMGCRQRYCDGAPVCARGRCAGWRARLEIRARPSLWPLSKPQARPTAEAICFTLSVAKTGHRLLTLQT